MDTQYENILRKSATTLRPTMNPNKYGLPDSVCDHRRACGFCVIRRSVKEFRVYCVRDALTINWMDVTEEPKKKRWARCALRSQLGFANNTIGVINCAGRTENNIGWTICLSHTFMWNTPGHCERRTQ